MMQSFKLRLILIVILLLIVIPLGISILQGIKHHGLIKVNLHVSPADSSLKVDGRNVKDVVYLKPGTHKIEASKDGWTPDIQTVEVKNGDKNLNVYLLPAPASEAANQWLKNNPSTQAQRETYGSQNFDKNSSDMLAKYPLISKLPLGYNQEEFAIDYGGSKRIPGGIEIEITGKTPRSRQHAIQQIKEWGYDPSDYEIVYLNETNPFTVVEQE